MQTTTWVEMAFRSVIEEEGAFFPTLASSISGQKKCSRCCQLEENRHDDGERSLQWESKGFVAVISKEIAFLIPKFQESEYIHFGCTLSDWADRPDVPPPRV